MPEVVNTVFTNHSRTIHEAIHNPTTGGNNMITMTEIARLTGYPSPPFRVC